MATSRTSRASSRPAPAARYGFLTVGETARILGVSPSTLRLWESEGLVAPMRTSGRYRLYSPDMLKLLKRIKYLRDVQRLNMPGIKRELRGRDLPYDAMSETGEGPAPQVAIKTPMGTRASRAAAAAQLAASAPALASSAPALAPARKSRKAERPLGPQLRKMRERKKLGLIQAAKQAGISPGFLSAVERSKANASVATLQRLAATYGTTTMELFQTPRHEGRLVAVEDRRVLTVDPGVRMELLSTGAPMLQSMLFRVAPLAGSEGSYSHQGEEFIYMLSGTLEVWLDELDCFVLRDGDSFWFPSTHAHRWFNPGHIEAVLLWINTPPTF